MTDVATTHPPRRRWLVHVAVAAVSIGLAAAGIALAAAAGGALAFGSPTVAPIRSDRPVVVTQPTPSTTPAPALGAAEESASALPAPEPTRTPQPTPRQEGSGSASVSGSARGETNGPRDSGGDGSGAPGAGKGDFDVERPGRPVRDEEFSQGGRSGPATAQAGPILGEGSAEDDAEDGDHEVIRQPVRDDGKDVKDGEGNTLRDASER